MDKQMDKQMDRQSSLNHAEPAYRSLLAVLYTAFDQATIGKGQRHVSLEHPTHFEDQDICEELREFGLGPAVFQIRKKAKEVFLAHQNGTFAHGDVLGIIVYAAALAIVLQEEDHKRKMEAMDEPQG